MTEVVAPNGYQLLKDPVSISENDFSPENSQYDVNSRVLTLTISNEKANHRQLKVTKNGTIRITNIRIDQALLQLSY